MSSKQAALDDELQRVLKIAADMAPVQNELQIHTQQSQSTWPWQVPQVPSYTSDHAPQPKI